MPSFNYLSQTFFQLFQLLLPAVTGMSVVKKFPSFVKNIEFSTLTATKDRIKCYCLSDLHADSEKSQIWVREHCQRRVEDQEGVYTVFIVPGDVGSEIDRLESVFKVLTENYDAVIYVPGNHEAWRRGIAAGGSATRPEERTPLANRMADDSIQKINEVLECARACGVYVGPLRIQYADKDKDEDKTSGVTIFPLYSWYHASWDKEPELTNTAFLEVEEVVPFAKKWGDFSMCSWPPELLSQSDFASTTNDNTILAEGFAELNEVFLDNPLDGPSFDAGGEGFHASPLVQEGDTVLSFSHFLPRQELCPEKRFLLEPMLAKVIGSDPLETQIRRLNPHLHMFGHTHIPIDLELEGIRYLQWPLGYTRESDKQCAPIHNSGPLLVFDSFLGTGKSAIPKHMESEDTTWTQYYRANTRHPERVSELAPWVLARLESYSGLVASNRKQRELGLNSGGGSEKSDAAVAAATATGSSVTAASAIAAVAAAADSSHTR